jgi:hypothetical protein
MQIAIGYSRRYPWRGTRLAMSVRRSAIRGVSAGVGTRWQCTWFAHLGHARLARAPCRALQLGFISTERAGRVGSWPPIISYRRDTRRGSSDAQTVLPATQRNANQSARRQYIWDGRQINSQIELSAAPATVTSAVQHRPRLVTVPLLDPSNRQAKNVRRQ